MGDRINAVGNTTALNTIAQNAAVTKLIISHGSKK